MKNEGPERGPARPSGAGDNYCSRVSKQRSVPWRHQIISLIRGTVIIIQSNKALGALGPARATVLVASMLLGLYRPRLMRSTRGYLMKRLLDPGQNALAPPSLGFPTLPFFPLFFQLSLSSPTGYTSTKRVKRESERGTRERMRIWFMRILPSRLGVSAKSSPFG